VDSVLFTRHLPGNMHRRRVLSTEVAKHISAHTQPVFIVDRLTRNFRQRAVFIHQLAGQRPRPAGAITRPSILTIGINSAP